MLHSHPIRMCTETATWTWLIINMLNLKILDKQHAIISRANCFPYGFPAWASGVGPMSEVGRHHAMELQALEHGANSQNYAWPVSTSAMFLISSASHVERCNTETGAWWIPQWLSTIRCMFFCFFFVLRNRSRVTELIWHKWEYNMNGIVLNRLKISSLKAPAFINTNLPHVQFRDSWHPSQCSVLMKSPKLRLLKLATCFKQQKNWRISGEEKFVRPKTSIVHLSRNCYTTRCCTILSLVHDLAMMTVLPWPSFAFCFG